MPVDVLRAVGLGVGSDYMGAKLLDGLREPVGCTMSVDWCEAVLEKTADTGGTLASEALVAWVADRPESGRWKG